MPPIPGADAGPVALLIFGIAAIVLGAIRGDWVPGWLFKQEREQRLKAETQAERNTEALEAVAATVKAALERRAGDGT